jgi:uroporphyrinogen-III decarboxylase
MMGDLYRQPDLVLKALERMTPLAIKTGLGGPEVSGNPIVFIPLHKGADGWMSDEQFRTFYWPSLKALILALIDEGCVPFLFAEGGYNSRLEYLNEVPKGHCIWLFDQTDMAKAKNVVGGTNCIAGNVPISKIMTGTPEQVKEVCKKLIDVAGKGGGYIMSMGCAADEGKADTVHAMIDFTKEYGVYK